MAKITWEDRTDNKTPLGVLYEAAAYIYNTLKASVNALYDGTDTELVNNVTIKKDNGLTYRIIRSDDNTGKWQELTLSDAIAELWASNQTEDWQGGIQITEEFFDNNNGGTTIYAHNIAQTLLAGISVMANGTIMVGDLANSPLGTFTKMFFKHDYTSLWDALSAAEKDRIITDFGYQFENFLSKLTTDPQTVAGDVGFEKGINITETPGASADGVRFNGDTKIYEFASDTLRIAIGGTNEWEFTGSFFKSITLRAAYIRAGATAVSVNAYAFNGDANTGMSSFDEDELSLVAGGIVGLLIKELAGVITNTFTDSYGSKEVSTDPADPAEGQHCIFQSDGTGSGDDGDIMIKITAGGVTKTTTLVDFSTI